MPYIVIEKRPGRGEMHVVNSNGNLSFSGPPKKFLSKERAQEIALMWAEINANCDQNAKMVVRKV